MSSNPGWFARHKFLSVVLAAFLVFGVVGTVNADDSADPDRDAQGTTATDTQDEAAAREDDDAAGESTDAEPASGKDGSKAEQKPTQPQPRTYLVARIVDGDTLELGNGEMVRLVGIDTPEVGECGYDRASEALARMILGQAVTLEQSDEDRDRYGRLLRYVNVGNMDAGLQQIKHGMAIARYDSRDGYGFHPREPRYIAADKGTKTFSCPKPLPVVPQPVGGGCDPNYTPCVPVYPPDLDCADVNGPITVTGSDPHGLDGEGDGIACE